MDKNAIDNPTPYAAWPAFIQPIDGRADGGFVVAIGSSIVVGEAEDSTFEEWFSIGLDTTDADGRKFETGGFTAVSEARRDTNGEANQSATVRINVTRQTSTLASTDRRHTFSITTAAARRRLL